MPTVFAHALVPLAVGIGLGGRRVPTRLLWLGLLASALPDADVVGFKLGIAYADALGHRGASHSLLFALLMATLAAFGHRWLRCSALTAFVFIAIAAASHPLLDMLTNGGLGIALYWPWSDSRHFFPCQVIAVSPFADHFFTVRGWQVLLSEARWIGLPALATVVALRCLFFDSSKRHS